jgi:hypothetical protein
LSYIDVVASWTGDSIATYMGVPGYAKNSIYNYFALAFWLTTGPVDVALIWSNPI